MQVAYTAQTRTTAASITRTVTLILTPSLPSRVVHVRLRSCTICTKKGHLHLYVPPAHFQLLTPLSAVTTYTFGTHTAQHHFCAHCGISPFYRARSRPDDYDLNARCLDEYHELARSFDIEQYDGRNWEQANREEQARQLGHNHR